MNQFGEFGECGGDALQSSNTLADISLLQQREGIGIWLLNPTILITICSFQQIS